MILKALKIYFSCPGWSLEADFGLYINGLINNLILKV